MNIRAKIFYLFYVFSTGFMYFTFFKDTKNKNINLLAAKCPGFSEILKHV